MATSSMSATTSTKDGYYERTASGYNELYGEEQDVKFGEIRPYWLLTNRHLVLDIGCGTGLAHQRIPGRLIGVDPARAMLSFLRYPCAVGRAESLPFRTGTFDGIICVTALHHVVSIDAALGEINRVAKPGCQCAITILKRSSRAQALIARLKASLLNPIAIDAGKDVIVIGIIDKQSN